MTSEIVALNRSAVALAADSAVTVGGKVFNSAEKIFALSRVNPIGIMIYGTADFMGIPWETIIKLYRGKYDESDLATVRDHGERFFRYVESEAGIFSAEHIAHDLLSRMSRNAKEFFDPVFKDSTGPQKSATRLRKMVGTKIDTFYEEFKAYMSIGIEL
ncbi:MAG: hypothetical protein HN394_05490 [Rhodospirillaceae bacterium]|jgi:hypothetical protein|nr:hypothetical protein [Rhodospirillaceae bacterium]